MGDWSDILSEINDSESKFDLVRRKYIREFSDYTNRNVICYYSAWLTKQSDESMSIVDADMTGFMTCVRGLDCNKGLDLVLHTPGGSPNAAEAIVTYLRSKFNNDIRVFVPHMAMSAGTMIACSAKEIFMGRHSSLGPIDPQFNGIPAYNILQEFLEAKEDLKTNPNNARYWAIKLQQYPAAFMKTAIDAIQLSGELAMEWLGTCMFDKDGDKDKISAIVSHLNEHDDSKNHGRHFSSDYCKSIGLKVSMLEDDPELQEKVLTMHHSFMITMNSTNAIKLIENQERKAYIIATK